ncbi:MAG: flagellar protein FlgN [Gammaproteobacteria bacterium]|nr:flagellar protein FlgN [Gammaproteobacteria bacterium]
MTDSPLDKNASELEEVLSDGIEFVHDLKAVLVQEREALERRDTKLLEEAAKTKQTLAKNLAMFDFFRADIETLAENESGPFSDSWTKFQSVARDCDELNRTNGAIIRSRHEQVLAGLSLLQGREQYADTYTSNGAAEGSPGRRKLTEV